MKIPSKITICGVSYKIKYDAKYLEGIDSVGQINFDSGIIYLTKKGVSEDVLEQTFVHEVIHGVLYAMSHDLQTDENFVNSLSMILHQVMKQVK